MDTFFFAASAALRMLRKAEKPKILTEFPASTVQPTSSISSSQTLEFPCPSPWSVPADICLFVTFLDHTRPYVSGPVFFPVSSCFGSRCILMHRPSGLLRSVCAIGRIVVARNSVARFLASLFRLFLFGFGSSRSEATDLKQLSRCFTFYGRGHRWLQCDRCVVE